MSGPFRFSQEAASPLEQRSASPFSSGQPVSFKTNVNRMKTQKWVQAKKNAYDGDDWGEYDEYDEYGVDQEPKPEPASRYYAQRFGAQSRSFTAPIHQASPQSARRNSFEAGEEHRAFSASVAPPQQGNAQQQQHPHSDGQPSQQGRGAEPDISAEQQHNSSASVIPTSPQTRISSIPTDVYSAPSNSQFPPRKSSIGHMSSPIATSPQSRTGGSEKPVAFIRPADIYKRVEEERQRASLDDSSSNLDSLSSRPGYVTGAPQADSGNLTPSLETVAERKSEYSPNHGIALQQDGQPAEANDPQSLQQTRLSQLRPISTSSNDPWFSASQSQTQASDSVVSPPSDSSFRSFVDQAFTRRDDQRSVPPTPISDSEMHRSNTGSTSGISPIMSRVPSSAAAVAKLRNQGSTPAIAEERETPVSRPTSAHIPDVQHQGLQRHSPGHSRNISASSIPHSGLVTPTSGDSPARSPVVSSRIALPAPETAHIGTESPNSPDAMDGGLNGPSSAYATREADIAHAMMSSPVKSVPELSAAELKSQDAFLESHNAQSPIDDVMPRDRSESPSKGRVQALAGRFGEVSNSRRGSTQSDNSRHSLQSWERSHDHSRAPSPTKVDPSKSASPVKEFRPHLPGQWESYATTAATPSDKGEKEKGLGFEHDSVSSPLEEVDLTPTTAKQRLSVVEPSQSSGTISALTEDPISALKEAGAAVVQSIRTTVGLDDTSSESYQEQQRYSQNRSHGDVYMPRPLQLDRTVSASSSIPPTPPAKATPESESSLSWREDNPQTSAQGQRPPIVPQLSTAPAADDQESDRLRKEIVASLNPLRISTVPAAESNRKSSQPASPSENRASSILPLEYESYWADEKPTSPQTLQGVQRNLPEASPAAPASPPAQSGDSITPLLVHRFSWETNTPNPATPDAQAQTNIGSEPTKGLELGTTVFPTVEHTAEEERKQWADGLPDTITATKPGTITDDSLGTRSPTLPLDSANAIHSPTQESKRSSGLHVVNSGLDPEAVDLPPRLSADMSHPLQPGWDEPTTSHQQTEDGVPNPAIASMKGLTESSAAQDFALKSPTSPVVDKPLSAREIATINPTQERIATYNKMRDHWATVDHGLSNWVSAVFEANPELAIQPLPLQRVSTGTVRHKHTGSLPLLGKFTASMSGQPQGATQNDLPTATVFAGGNSPTAPMQSSSTSGISGRTARDQMQAQMQAKGEKLLHTAGVLSGKGMTSAKGLFAKGKSRFGRDKDSVASSREASEEPDLSTIRTTSISTPETPVPLLADANSLNGKKRRRRFSMPFQRSSRSKSGSRPSSIVFPTNMPSSFCTPSEERLGRTGRPHSFHAPDSWSSTPRLQTPPPQSQTIVGTLPPPTKSPFSSSSEHNNDAPPMSKIPDGFDNEEKRNSNRTLQSICGHCTPPTLGENAGDSPLECMHDKSSHHSNDKSEKPLPPLPGQPDEDDDLPPRIDYDPLPVAFSFQSGEVSPVVSSFAPSHASDSEDEVGFLRPNSTSALQEPTAAQILADVSPLLPPAKYPLDNIPDNDGLETPTNNKNGGQISVETAAIGRNDTPPVSDHKTAMTLQQVASKLCSTSGNVDRDSLPISSPKQQHHAADSPDMEVMNYRRLNTPGTPKLTLLETGTFGAGSISPTSICLQDENTMPRVERSSPLAAWFTDSNLRPPEITADTPEQNANQAVNLIRPNQDGAESGRLSPISKQADEVQLEGVAGNVSLSETWTSPLNPPAPRQRAVSNVSAVSATQLQVVHAVEEYAASNSSFASWDNDSIAHSEISQPGGLRNESDLLTPVAQGPNIIQHRQAEEEDDANTPSAAMSNGYFLRHEVPDASRHQAQQLPVSTSDTTGPERSKSLLSVISSMVSDVTPISPSSSTAGRSTPSTIHRMQNDSLKPTRAPPQIPEESFSANNELTPTLKNYDYDLYADHNGLVKDLRDECGQPFRVPASDQGPVPLQNIQLAKPEASLTEDASETRDADMPRYSTERPLSFVSGSQDEEGKPQDQINRSSPSVDLSVLPDFKQDGNQLPPSSPSQVGVVHPAVLSPLNGQQSNHTTQQQQKQQPESKRPLSPGSVPQQRKSWDMNTMTYKTPAPRMPISSPPPPLPQPTTLPMQSEDLPTNDQTPSNRQVQNRPVQDPRMYGMALEQPVPQGLPTQKSPLPDQDPQIHGQPSNNEIERQQFVLQLQTNQAQFRGLENQAVRIDQQLPSGQIPKQQDKRSHVPKVSSVFKGFGGKPQPSPQQPPDTLSSTRNPNGKLVPVDPNRRNSYHSAVSSISHEPVLTRYEGQSISRNQSPSNGADSDFSHVSRGSTRAQPTDSRTDLRKPAGPAPFHGIPPQLPLIGALIPSGHPQHQRVAMSAAPETGKKKRFSALGALFGRGEKKATKLQRHSTPPLAQPQTSQQWPPPQQQHGSPPLRVQYPPNQVFPNQVPPNQVPPNQVPPNQVPPNQVPPNSVPGMHPMGSSFTSNQTTPLQQHYPHPKPGPPYQQQPSSVRPDENSAFLNTKRLAEEHAAKLALAQQSQQANQVSRPGPPVAPVSFERPSHGGHGPLGRYYRSDKTGPPPSEQGAYAASRFAQQQALQQSRQAPVEPGAYGASQAARQQAEQPRQPPTEPGAYGTSQAERMQTQRQQQHFHSRPNSVVTHHTPLSNRNVSGSVPVHDAYIDQTVSSRHMSLDEPRYETPQIPAAYNPVSGAFISPRDQAQLPLFHPQHDVQGRLSLDQRGRQYSDSQMQQLSPQISAQSQMPPYGRSHSDASTVSMISPISNTPPNVPVPNQRSQHPRMGSISEVRNQEQPWNVNVPAGATEQEIVRARQRQYIEEQFNAQQQLHAERVARSTSPRVSSQNQSPSPQLTPGEESQVQSGGFREVLPRKSPQPYPISTSTHSPDPAYISSSSRSPHVVQPMPVYPGQATNPAAYPLPMSPQSANISSPVNPVAQDLPPPPPPKVPHSPMNSSFHEPKSPLPHEQHPAHRSHQYQSSPSTENQWPLQQQQYEEPIPNEPPPLYQGVGVVNGGMDKARPERSRPPNITTNTASSSQPRQRQSSIGILQHPQPASMAASPVSSAPHMGSESLRRQLLEQEERARLERVQRAHMARIESERERQEREFARARARELERSVSGGGRVGSLRSVTGSRNTAPGWERRGSVTRPVFELPAMEDDEPVMRATSFPGQEWVPTVWTDD